MPEFNTLVPIFLGWLFGLLTPGIAERIRRPYRRRDLMRAVVDEMAGLQYIMASAACNVRMRNAQVSDAFLDEVLPIFEGYNGPDREEAFLTATREIRSFPEQQRSAIFRRSVNRMSVS